MKLLGWSLPDTIGNLHLLWWWALDFAPTGDLSRYDAEQLTADLDLCGATPEQFVEAMVSAGFLDQIGETLCIHDWTDYNRPKPRKKSASPSRPAEGGAESLSHPAHLPASSSRPAQTGQSVHPVVPPRRDLSESSSNPAPVDTLPGQESHSANAEQNSSPVVSVPPRREKAPIPDVLDQQPGFTDIWWPKLLEESRERGCTLDSIKQGKVLERLAREPLAAIPALKKSIASYSHTDSDAPAVLIANST